MKVKIGSKKAKLDAFANLLLSRLYRTREQVCYGKNSSACRLGEIGQSRQNLSYLYQLMRNCGSLQKRDFIVDMIYRVSALPQNFGSIALAIKN